MRSLRTWLVAVALLTLLGATRFGTADVSAHGDHTKTHPTTAHVLRREHHHGSGVTSHQHHPRHARHQRTHGTNHRH